MRTKALVFGKNLRISQEQSHAHSHAEHNNYHYHYNFYSVQRNWFFKAML